MNEISLTTRSGSWLIYDWLGLETPAGLELSEVTGTVLGSLQSPAVLVERDGRLMQTVKVPVRHFGEPTAGASAGRGSRPVGRDTAAWPGQLRGGRARGGGSHEPSA